MTITESLKSLLTGDRLSRNDSAQVMDSIMSGECTGAQIAGWLIALRQKGESAEEVAGFVESMRRHSLTITPADENAVDGCGTGGDGSHSFNISTASAIVAAGAGATVAKHGNRSVSSKCGSADLLERAGGKIDAEPAEVKQSLDDIGFGFMFAPRFHPAMKHAIGPRRELGVRTVFNILGPMTNPAGVKRQVIGVYHPSLMELMGNVLMMTGSKHVLVVHARDGLDEFSVCAETDFLECKDGQCKAGRIKPSDAGLAEYPAGALSGGGPEENLRILRDVLNGTHSPYYDATVFNGGAMLYVAGKAESIREGASLAGKAIDDGRARQTLADWVATGKD